MPYLVSTFGDRQLLLNISLPEQCRIQEPKADLTRDYSSGQPRDRMVSKRSERHWLGAARVRVFGNRALKPICYWFGLELELLEHASAGIRPVHAHCARQVCSYGGSFIIALNYGLVLLML
ncbi:hypothetical protein TWF751_006468 [Orbilia oligospora]|nr:hypothetical protein TWF751_006468 [Orbilia oligospora]